MFGMGDMAMGSALQMNGMMDMSQGIMLTQMGMPGLGAAEMGIGAMQMGMGQNMMNMGMMQNMYGGYGMGYGMDYGMGYGMGYGGGMMMDAALMAGCMGIGCTLACCNPGIYRRGCMGIGCNLSCCMPRRRYGNCRGYGCTLPCCQTTTQVIILNGNGSNQYQYQNQQYQNNSYQNRYQNQPPQYQNQSQQYQQYSNQSQNQQYQSQQYQGQGQYRNPNANVNQNFNKINQQQNTNTNQQQPYQNIQQKNQNNSYQNQNPQNIKYETPYNQAQNKQEAKLNKSQLNYPQIPEYKSSINNQKSSSSQFSNYNINKSLSDSVQQYKDQVFASQNQADNNPQYFNQNLIYQSHLLKRHGFNWTEYPTAMLTRQYLIDQPIQHMTKIKIKMDVTHNNCCFMKVTMYNTDDHFYGCYKNDLCDWFCSIIWAKLALINKQSDRFQQFIGFIQGNILRKSQFLGNWQHRLVKIDSQGLKSYRTQNELPTLTLTSIKQLWCRFEYLNGGNYIVIKCKSNGTKYEYGIPINNLFPWIKAFYSLLV